MNKIKKIIKGLYNECKAKGAYHFCRMYLSNLIAILRGFKWKIVYPSNIKSSFFFIQSRSKIDIYSKNVRLIIKPLVFIRRNTTIRMDHNSILEIGEKVFINDNCSINCIHNIRIGDYTKIGPGVSINDNDHNFRAKKGDERMLKGDIIIGKNVWIGANTVILRGTTIGDNAVIAAGSVLKGYVAPNTVFLNKRENLSVEF